MSDSTRLIRGGHVVDPSQGIERPADVIVRDGVIVQVGDDCNLSGVETLDASGCIVAPGLIDLHVHLRVPGFEAKETIATGTAAAAAGGFTTICCMPNTRPALDRVEALEDLNARIARDAVVRVYPIAAITLGRAGEQAVDFAALAAAGAIGFSDDGDTTRDSAIMRRALDASRDLNLPIMVHCEDKALADGAMNEGLVSRQLGISGIPPEAEEIIIARDLMLAHLTGGWLHVLHVSTGRGIDLIRQAKADGVHVTAEVMPHHLTMSDDWVAGDRTLLNVNEPAGEPATPGHPDTKVNPPLRTAADTRRLLDALKDGSFDVIATDHAPHASPEKTGTDFEHAAMGMNGLEFALPLLLALVRAGHLTIPDLIRRLSVEPARLLGKPGGTLAPGAPADIVVFDPTETWRVTPEILRTKSANTPLLGMTLTGRTRYTLVGGQVKFHD
ncbi:MAG: dihydroorotase [Thermomicrobiales bacterium]|jgi:dihydroorotase|nr:dihydroorotase [Thermomicrobiales bacterium]